MSGPVGSTFTISPSRSNSQTRHGAAGEPAAQAGVVEQLARMSRGGRAGRDRRATPRSRSAAARADGNGDHVLLEPLVVADPGIAAGRQHVDEAVFGDHLEPDVGIGGEKGRHDARAGRGAPR